MRAAAEPTDLPAPGLRGGGWRRLLVPSVPCLLGMIAFAAVCFAPQPGRVLSFDTFLHVYMGEEMLRLGERVETDPSNWAVDHRYIDHEWVPQLLMGALHQSLGLEGLVLFTALMVGAVFGLLAAWMGRRGAGPLVTAGLLAAAFVALRLFMLARPFLITWLLAVIWTMLLDRLIRGELEARRWVVIAVPLMWLWANLHAGFFFGFFLLGIFGLGQLWRIVAGDPASRRGAVRLFLWMVGGGQLALFASALNPYGFRLHAHFLVYLANQPLVSQIIEWQSPYFHQREFLAALVLIGVLLAIWMASRRRLEPVELLLVIALLLFALKAQRNLPLFALLTLPYAGGRLEELIARRARSGSRPSAPARWIGALSRGSAATAGRRGGAVTAALLAAAAILGVGVHKLHPAQVDDRKLPAAAASFVADRPELFGGRMLNFYAWGGYLAWRLSPGHQVFINGLQDHHGAAHQATYHRVVRAAPEWRQTLDELGIGWVIVPARSALTTVLDLHDGWRRVYRDSMAEIFVRAAGPPGSVASVVPSWAQGRLDELPNVLVVVLDTVRDDALGAGDAADARSAFDRLAGEGIRFTRARSTSAWTLPAHGSLFTGLHPSRHGAHGEHELLTWQQVTLAELLAPTHETVAFSENPHVTQAKGFAQGFEIFDETWRRRDRREPTLESVADWLARRSPERPFFLFVNLMTAHLPYRPPADLAERFLPPEAGATEVEAMRAFDERQARLFMSGALRLERPQIEILRALYRADVAAADRRLGALLQAIEAAGELDDTLVVVLSDHGENIGDHALMEHQLCLYESLLRVPLALRLPGEAAAGRGDDSPVQLVDVAPTVLDVVGVPADRWPPMAGRSLVAGAVDPERALVAEYMRPREQRRLFAAVDPAFDFGRFDRRLQSIQVGSWKLIQPEGGPPELYDPEADPGETRNLAGERPEVVAELRRRLEAWNAGRPPQPAPTDGPSLDEETREALRSLGYLD